MTSQNCELDQLAFEYERQTALIESLEKELSSLRCDETLSSNHSEAELVKKLTTENEKLKYRINILKKSIQDSNSNSLLTASSKHTYSINCHL